MHYTGVHRTLREEIANSITHGFGVALAIAGLVFLVIYSAATGDPWKIVSCSIYGASLVILYTSSTLYHSFQQPRLKTSAANSGSCLHLFTHCRDVHPVYPCDASRAVGLVRCSG